jgi:KipI family sensor histidine kinase inhibitor
VEIAVRYDGDDLGEVAQRTGMSPAEVVELHRAGAHAVAFGGFAPGFAYIAGLDPRLHQPRRATPRTRVPAGAVAIADRFTGIYPRESPGGWWIVGYTDAVLWDLEADPPALLVPGARVRFVEAGA